MSDITEDMIDGLKCVGCGYDTCCPNCSFIDWDGDLHSMCHDCGDRINYPEDFNKRGAE